MHSTKFRNFTGVPFHVQPRLKSDEIVRFKLNYVENIVCLVIKHINVVYYSIRIPLDQLDVLVKYQLLELINNCNFSMLNCRYFQGRIFRAEH